MFDMSMIDFDWLYDKAVEYVTVTNVSLAVAVIFALTFLVILPVLCLSTGGVRICRFRRRLQSFVNVFKRINSANLPFFNKTVAKKMPKRVRKAWLKYSATGTSQALNDLKGAMTRSIDKSGTSCFVVYLVVFVLGVMACSAVSIFAGVTVSDGAVYLAGALMLGAILFVLLAYIVYLSYNKYKKLAKEVPDMIVKGCCADGGLFADKSGTNTQAEVMTQDNAKVGDTRDVISTKKADILEAKDTTYAYESSSKVLQQAESEDMQYTQSNVDELIDLVSDIVAKGASREVLSLLTDGLTRLHATKYMSGADLIKLSYLINELERKIAI